MNTRSGGAARQGKWPVDVNSGKRARSSSPERSRSPMVPGPDNAPGPAPADEVTGVNILTVHNVLASGFLGAVKLDLDKICANFGNSYFNPSEFPATRIDVRGQCGSIYSVSVFESGRIQSTGGCWPDEAKRAMKKIAKKLKHQLGYANVHFTKFEIQNILAVIDLGHHISLSRLCKLYRNVDYEPERFPVARIRVPIGPRSATPSPQDASAPHQVDAKRAAARIVHASKEEVVTVNVFGTGKVTFTGGKSIESIHQSLNEIRPFVHMCRQ